jgi:hypothetical protein
MKGKSVPEQSASRTNEDVIGKVLMYLVKHPDAKDTIEGIENWWLPDSTTGEAKQKLKESLDTLVSKGWLVARRSHQSETIYSLNRESLPEIRQLLSEE